jgi:SulP family sulfate permease
LRYYFIPSFAWESAKRIRARKYVDENGGKTLRIDHYFLVSTTAFSEKFDVENDPSEI